MDTIDGGIMMRYKPIEGDRIILGSFKKALGKALMRRMEQSAGCGWLKSINIIDQISINEIKPAGMSPFFYSLMNSTALWISSVLALNPSHLHFLKCKACKGRL